MKFFKVVSFFIVAVLMLSVLVSCGNDEVINLVRQANDNLTNDPVAINTMVTVECEKKLVKDYFGFSDTITKIYKDGNNTLVSTVLNKKPVSYTFADNKVYVESASSKCYAKMSRDQFNNYSDKLDVSDTALNISVFKSIELKNNSDGTKTVTCKGIDESDQRVLNRIMSEVIKQAKSRYTVDFDRVEYIATLNSEGCFVNAKTVVPLLIDYYGLGDVDVFVISSSFFDYTKTISVSEPENSKDYVKVETSDIFGS